LIVVLDAATVFRLDETKERAMVVLTRESTLPAREDDALPEVVGE
jgi:hypothetical protein